MMPLKSAVHRLLQQTDLAGLDPAEGLLGPSMRFLIRRYCLCGEGESVAFGLVVVLEGVRSFRPLVVEGVDFRCVLVGSEVVKLSMDRGESVEAG